MNNDNWLEYVKHCYDLVMESEGYSKLVLEHNVEAYVVHLMARNFNRIDIGTNPIGIQIMSALADSSKDKLLLVADECLLINSFPLRQHKWPTKTYYSEMGIIAYGLAGHIMEKHFNVASQVIHGVFNRNLNQVGSWN